MRWNLKEAGSEEHTNSWANLWSDEQKSHIRLCMRIRLPTKSKSNNYTESCMIKEAVDNLDMDGMQQVADELKIPYGTAPTDRLQSECGCPLYMCEKREVV